MVAVTPGEDDRHCGELASLLRVSCGVIRGSAASSGRSASSVFELRGCVATRGGDERETGAGTECLVSDERNAVFPELRDAVWNDGGSGCHA